ncbi:MAG: hypothetical protein ACRCTP_22875 [Aeromonas popoffii]|uniref:hypothetical protein n=1 Tax=Aeromonas popoffii TaxID=70856 RepID=UPI003F3849A8
MASFNDMCDTMLGHHSGSKKQLKDDLISQISILYTPELIELPSTDDIDDKIDALDTQIRSLEKQIRVVDDQITVLLEEQHERTTETSQLNAIAVVESKNKIDNAIKMINALYIEDRDGEVNYDS